MRFFTFLFRPIFYDATNAFGLIVSLENLILLIITIKMFFSKPFQCLKKASFLIKGLFVFFLLSSVIFSLILGNLGIMIRMKNMIMPSFFIFLLWIFSKNEEIKTIYYSQKRTK